MGAKCASYLLLLCTLCSASADVRQKVPQALCGPGPNSASGVEGSLAAQAAEIQALRSVVSDLVDLVKSTQPLSTRAGGTPPRHPPPPLALEHHSETARRTSMPSNWTAGGPARIKIFTKDFDPFSIKEDDGRVLGYTHDFIKELLSSAFNNSEAATTEVLGSNEEIFAKLQSEEECQGATLCLGAAAISITSNREEFLDFLPSYFESGLKVMVKGKLGIATIMRRVFEAVGLILIAIAAFFLFFTLLLFPFCWVFEMLLNQDAMGLPIFISKAELDREKQRLEGEWVKIANCRPSSIPDKDFWMTQKRAKFIEIQSLQNAFLWTLFILAGSNVAYPKSFWARGVRCVGLTLQRAMVVVITAVAATVLTTESLLAQASSVHSFTDLANRKVCAIKDSEAFRFLSSQTYAEMHVISDISTKEEMFWLWEQFPRGVRTCEAVVYDWPLLQVGYIYHGDLNKTRTDTCLQCPHQAILVGQALNADPYGIAMPIQHPLLGYLQEKTLAVIRNIDLRKRILNKWKLDQNDIRDFTDIEGAWSLIERFAWYYLFAFLGLLALSGVWYLAFRFFRSKLDLRKIDARLHDSETTSYLLQETAYLDSSFVHLSEDYGLTHEIRVQLNRVQAAVVIFFSLFTAQYALHIREISN